MGGLIIILATSCDAPVARLDSRYVVVAVIAMLWAGAIGFLDDSLRSCRQVEGWCPMELIARSRSRWPGIALILWRWPRTCPHIHAVAVFK